MKKIRAFSLALVCVHVFVSSASRADILTTAYFTGQILRYNDLDNSFSTFAAISSGVDAFPGLSGIAVDSVGNRVYASARESARIYQFDATTGAQLGFQQLSGIVPTGLAFNGGKLYVANNGGNTVEVYKSGLVFDSTISLPDLNPGTLEIDDNLPSGIAVTSDNRLIISTFAGGGVYTHNLGTNVTTTFNNANPVANSQVAIAIDGTVYVGNGAFASSVFKFDANGNAIGAITVGNPELPLPALPYVSQNNTAPSGVFVDPDGNLIVSALGRTNPFDMNDSFQSNGGLFKFSQAGVLLQTYGTGLTPLSSAAFISAVPEPSSIAMLSAVAGGLGWRNRRKWLGK